MHRIIAIVLLLTLSLQQGLSLLATALVVNEAQSYASDDAMLICTGSDYRWISQSAFIEFGETVYLEAPSDAPTTDGHSLDCGYKYLSLHDDHVGELPHIAGAALAHQQLVQRLAQRPYTAYPYQHSLSRAPPHLA